MTAQLSRRTVLVLAPVLMSAAAWAAEDQYAFMPDGGRTLLAGLLDGLGTEAKHDALRREADAEDWAEWAQGLAPDLDPAAMDTLAAYAALNLPLEGESADDIPAQDVAGALPPDGKDLAVAQCQFCHSLFSGYLMHDRDKAGWLSTFKAPFHTEIPMTEVERETFATYSAINMPLDFEDVPPELRF